MFLKYESDKIVETLQKKRRGNSQKAEQLSLNDILSMSSNELQKSIFTSAGEHELSDGTL